jgi:hypothetical protein
MQSTVTMVNQFGQPGLEKAQQVVECCTEVLLMTNTSTSEIQTIGVNQKLLKMEAFAQDSKVTGLL